MEWPYALRKFMAQPRFPCGTQEWPLTAASFRTWQGSWVPVAQDPDVNTNSLRLTIQSSHLEQEFSLAIADCEYRAPLPPRLARIYYYSFLVLKMQWKKYLFKCWLYSPDSAPFSFFFWRSSLKKFFKTVLHCGSSTPDFTSTWWLNRGSSNKFIKVPAQPAFGSLAP